MLPADTAAPAMTPKETDFLSLQRQVHMGMGNPLYIPRVGWQCPSCG